MSQKNATNITKIEKEILKAIKDLTRSNKTPTFSGLVRQVKSQLGLRIKNDNNLIKKAIHKLIREGRIDNFGLNKYNLRRCSQTNSVVNNGEVEVGSGSVSTYVTTDEFMNISEISIASIDEEKLNRNIESVNENHDDNDVKNNTNVMMLQFEGTCENSEENLTKCRENMKATAESSHKFFENLEATNESCHDSFALKIEEIFSKENQVLENDLEVSQQVQENNVDVDSKLESKISEFFNSANQLEVKQVLENFTMKAEEEKEVLASSSSFIFKNETKQNTSNKIILEENEMNSNITLNSNIMEQANVAKTSEQHENCDKISSSVSSNQSCADNSNFLTSSIVRPFRRCFTSFFYGVNQYLRDMLNPLSTLNYSVVPTVNDQNVELNSQSVIFEPKIINELVGESTKDVWLSFSIEDNEQ